MATLKLSQSEHRTLQLAVLHVFSTPALALAFCFAHQCLNGGSQTVDTLTLRSSGANAFRTCQSSAWHLLPTLRCRPDRSCPPGPVLTEGHNKVALDEGCLGQVQFLDMHTFNHQGSLPSFL